MLGLRLHAKDTDPLLEEMVFAPLPEGWVEIRLRAAALNHRDVWIQKGLYAGIRYPCVPGSDGAGYLDDEPMIINPGMFWGEHPAVQAKDFRILGMPDNGTFAQRVQVPAEQVHPVPSHLSMEEAAAIPLAGVTAFRALFTQGKLQQGERLLITGIGGGVARWVFQFAKAIGVETWVSSGSEEKLAEGLRQGAAGGFNYRDPEWKEIVRGAGGFDVVIDGAGGAFIGEVLKFLNPAARIVLYGGTVGPITHVLPQLLFWKQIRIIGSTMGSPEDFQGMLAFINAHRIVPVIDRIYTLEEGAEAFRRMAAGAQSGKIVLQIPD
jgi:zinc-binding alcohol dehydrogenase/oxidoreductase